MHDMKAIVFDHFGPPENLVMRTLPIPEPQTGEVRIRVRAFGINSAEAHMRAGDWGEVAPVTGIECVGEVDCDPERLLPIGQCVAAACGGLGRTRNGSYAEYVVVPRSNTFVLDPILPWAELATLPESYSTAWIALFDNLRLNRGHVLLVRGATSALGQAAVNLAVGAGATVLATTRHEHRAPLLTALGAARVLVDDGKLSDEVRRQCPAGIDGVLEIVGARTIRDSLRMPRKGGSVCYVGFLGGMGAIDGFDPIVDLPSGVNLNFFASAFALGTDAYPASSVPLREIVEKAAAGIYQAKPVSVFSFDDIREAHRRLESGAAGGKMVVLVSCLSDDPDPHSLAVQTRRARHFRDSRYRMGGTPSSTPTSSPCT
jgi:NADPH:quinone reductase-like Zn-dependent oxidoreductase